MFNSKPWKYKALKHLFSCLNLLQSFIFEEKADVMAKTKFPGKFLFMTGCQICYWFKHSYPRKPPPIDKYVNHSINPCIHLSILALYAINAILCLLMPFDFSSFVLVYCLVHFMMTPSLKHQRHICFALYAHIGNKLGCI